MFLTQFPKTKVFLFLAFAFSLVAGAVLFLKPSDITTVNASTMTRAEQVRESAFDELTEEANQKGRVKVIIGVNARFTPEGNLSEIAKLRQREGIENAQEDVLQKLTSFYVRSVKRFETIPFFAAEVDASTLESLRNDPMVTSIEPDEIAAPSLALSTPFIGAPEVWAAGYTGTNWAVAILDTGVEASHPFFGGRVVSEACYSTNSGSTQFSLCPGGVLESTEAGSGNDCDLSISGCGHGTHVAGIAAGSNESFSGVAKGAPIIAIQVFTRFTDSAVCGASTPCVRTYSSDYTKALERVFLLSSTMKIASANMSLGGGQFFANCDIEKSSIKDAIDQLRSVNIATVIASGNNGYTNSMSAPACISSAISVGSTSFYGTPDPTVVSSFSNSVGFLSLLAPGGLIRSSVPNGPNGLYGNKGGTSMATPHIAGAWSVLKQHTPSATVNQILSAISATGVPLVDSRNSVIKPRLQLNDALQGMGCSYTLGANSQTISAAGGSSTVSLTTGANCLWKTGKSVSWITVNSASSATGPGTVSITVAPNASGTARTGTVLIAGIPYTVTQDAANCTLSLNSNSQSIPASGGSGSIGITASESFCTWNAVLAPPQIFSAESASLGPIPDSTEVGPQVPGTPRDVQFVVSGVNTASVTNIAVSFTGTHSYMGDIEATLIAPNGTQHRVFGYTGALSVGSYGSNKGLNGIYSFSDSATQNWWTTVGGQTNPVPSGVYRTSNSGGAGATNPMPDTSIMTTFSTLPDMNGTWTLRLTDGGSGDTGAVSAANIQFVSGTPWISLNGATSGSGSGTVQYSVGENTSQSSRTGYISVAGQLFTITQAGTAAPPSGSIAGTVRYYFGASPLAVPNVTLSAAGAQNVSGSSGSNGTFSLTGFGSGAYTLTPSKTGQVGGISSLDASRVAQYSAALITLTPDQLIAADVTNNGSVNSLDAARIAQWIVGITSSGTNITGTWRFTPASRSYSSVTESLTGQDFTAILLGDVTGNWAPPAPIAEGQWGSRTVGQEDGSRKSVTSGRSDMAEAIGFGMYSERSWNPILRNTWSGGFDEVTLDVPSREGLKSGFDTRIARAGEVVSMPINVAGFGSSAVYSFDATVSYDPDVLEPVFESPIESLGTLSTNLNIVVNTSEPGSLRISAYGVTPMFGEGELIRVRFRVIVSNATESEIGFRSIMFNETDVTDAVSPGKVVVAGRRGQRAFRR